MTKYIFTVAHVIKEEITIEMPDDTQVDDDAAFDSAYDEVLTIADNRGYDEPEIYLYRFVKNGKTVKEEYI